MLKLFRRIRKNLLTKGNTANYLKYAIGEILLVVIGILIALSINNWNEERKIRIQEKTILEELDNNLQSNMEILEDFLMNQEQKHSEIKWILNHIESKATYSDSISIFLRNARIFEELSLVSSAYVSLSSIGFDLIRSKELRTEIIHLFNFVYDQNVQSIKRISDIQYQSTHDIYIKNMSFEEEQGNDRVIPNDYSAFLNNKEIYNLLSFRLAGKVGVIKMAFKLSVETKKVRNLLEDELAKS